MKFLYAIAAVVVLLIAGVFFATFRVDTFWQMATPIQHRGKYYSVSIGSTWCPASDQRGFIPGCSGPNKQPNGFVIEWRLDDDHQTIAVESISGTITWPDGSSHPLHAPFAYWYGEHTSHRNYFYAFASRGGYDDQLPPGKYRLSLSYTLNGQPTSFSRDAVLESTRKAGFHVPFHSTYF